MDNKNKRTNSDNDKSSSSIQPNESPLSSHQTNQHEVSSDAGTKTTNKLQIDNGRPEILVDNLCHPKNESQTISVARLPEDARRDKTAAEKVGPKSWTPQEEIQHFASVERGSNGHQSEDSNSMENSKATEPSKNRLHNWNGFRQKFNDSSSSVRTRQTTKLHHNQMLSSHSIQSNDDIDGAHFHPVTPGAHHINAHQTSSNESAREMVRACSDQPTNETTNETSDDAIIDHTIDDGSISEQHFSNETTIQGLVVEVGMPNSTTAQHLPPLLHTSQVRPDPQDKSNKPTGWFASCKGALWGIGVWWIPLVTCPALFIVVTYIAIRYSSPSSSSDVSSDPFNKSNATSMQTSNPTELPTFAPTTAKFMTIKDMVENETKMTISNDMPSPQLQAIHWLAYEDEFDLDLLDERSVIERYSLATIYFATGGEDAWGIGRCNFMTNQDVCDWKSISNYFSDLLGRIHFCGVICDSSRKYVTELWIEPDTLNGTLPEEVGLLSKLQAMLIEYNDDLVGSLPQSIGQLKNLVYLLIQVTGLSGELPSSLGNLSQLIFLDLSGNKFNGTLPSTLGNLQNLQHLSLWLNELTGTIPSSYANLSDLVFFSVAENFLSGTLPFKEDKIPQLIRLLLWNNLFEGTIPEVIFTFSNLQNLNLGGNFFTGTISSDFALLPKLVYLYLFDNFLVGSIPSLIGSLSNLEYLTLYDNILTGPIPSELGDLKNLRNLALYLNQISGTIPSEIGNLDHLELLALNDSPLTGGIPESIGNLTQLSWLSLYRTKINGTIPLSFSQLDSLRVLYVHETDLEGNMDFMSNLGPFSLAIADCCGDDPEIICSFCTHCCADDEGCFVHGTDIPFSL